MNKVLETKTDIVNLDRTRYSITTNNKQVLKLFKSLKIEDSGFVLKNRVSQWTSKPIDDYEKLLLFICDMVIIDAIIDSIKQIEPNLTIRHVKEQRQKRRKKNVTTNV